MPKFSKGEGGYWKGKSRKGTATYPPVSFACMNCGAGFKRSHYAYQKGLVDPRMMPKYCSRKCQLTNNKFRVGKQGNATTFRLQDDRLVGEGNHNWKGDNATYGTKHDWIAGQLGRPKECENCGTTVATRYEWANLSGEYKRDVSDWARLCKMCHFLFDGHERHLNRQGGMPGRKWKRLMLQ